MFVGPVVDHAAGGGVVSSEDFQHSLAVVEVVVEFSFDRYSTGDGAVGATDETAKWAILRLEWKLVRMTLEIRNLFLKDHAVNLQFCIAGGGEVRCFLTQPFHFKLEHFSEVIGGIGGIEALHPSFFVLLE